MPAVVNMRTRASKDRTAVCLANVVSPLSASCAVRRRLEDGCTQIIEIEIDVAYEKFYIMRNLRKLVLKSAKKRVLGLKEVLVDCCAMRFAYKQHFELFAWGSRMIKIERRIDTSAMTDGAECALADVRGPITSQPLGGRSGGVDPRPQGRCLSDPGEPGRCWAIDWGEWTRRPGLWN
jgi:hypothetical protein